MLEPLVDLHRGQLIHELILFHELEIDLIPSELDSAQVHVIPQLPLHGFNTRMYRYLLSQMPLDEEGALFASEDTQGEDRVRRVLLVALNAEPVVRVCMQERTQVSLQGLWLGEGGGAERRLVGPHKG